MYFYVYFHCLKFIDLPPVPPPEYHIDWTLLRRVKWACAVAGAGSGCRAPGRAWPGKWARPAGRRRRWPRPRRAPAGAARPAPGRGRGSGAARAAQSPSGRPAPPSGSGGRWRVAGSWTRPAYNLQVGGTWKGQKSAYRHCWMALDDM